MQRMWSRTRCPVLSDVLANWDHAPAVQIAQHLPRKSHNCSNSNTSLPHSPNDDRAAHDLQYDIRLIREKSMGMQLESFSFPHLRFCVVVGEKTSVGGAYIRVA